jgi:hypothetical protein
MWVLLNVLLLMLLDFCKTIRAINSQACQDQMHIYANDVRLPLAYHCFLGGLD